VAAIVSDSFTEAADTALASHVPDVGTGWVIEVNPSSVTPQVVGADDNLQVTPATANTTLIVTSRPNPTAAEYDVQFTLAAWGSSIDDPVWLVARFADASNYYAGGTYPGGAAADKKLVKCVAGVKTELASGDAGQVNGDVFKLEVRDGSKKLFQNGVEVLSTTDNALTAAGSAGIGWGSLGTASNDDTPSLTSRLDDYSVDQAAAATTSLLYAPLSPAVYSILMR
jgi:hypothetical protein